MPRYDHWRVAQQRSVLKNIKDVEHRYETTKASVERMFSVLPVWSAASIPELLIELEGLARTNGISVESISFQEAKNPSAAGEPGEQRNVGYRTVTVAAGARGTYESMKGFLQAVESSQHLMDVITLSLTAADAPQERTGTTTEEVLEERGASDIFSYTISINAYYQ